MKKWLLTALPLIIPAAFLSAQSVVVSTYFNAADPRDEWTELVVITDNTDMRNWTIRDNNSSQTGWQTAAVFANTAFWNNMRAGTIIMIWHRPVTSGGVAHPSDVNKDDGYIEVDLSNATYFSGASLGSSPTWSGNSMNIAGGGDVIQLRDASATHIHALGHISTAGTDWTALPSPKLNHANSANSGDAIYVCPGSSISEYGTTAPQSGTTWTSKNNSTITFGLPNTCGSSSTANPAFWYSLREPAMTAQTVTPSSVTPGSPGSLSFSWTACTDPNVADATTGYIILRNTSNSFTNPSDGTTYTNGSTIGSATVLTHITTSTTTSYTDNTVMNGNAYYYRVYAYRYTTDNLNGNSYNAARGRAYNTTDFVQVDYPVPLPVNLVAFRAEAALHSVALHWTTASETSNAYFSVERSDGQSPFTEIARVAGAGNSDQPLDYGVMDEHPLSGTNYYRLRQTDFNGENSCSAVLAVNMNGAENDFRVFYGNDGRLFFIFSCTESNEIHCEITDMTGRLIYTETLACGGSLLEALPENLLSKGVYLLRIRDGAKLFTQKFVR